MKAQQGVTLVETVMVIVLLSLISTTALIGFTGNDSLILDAQTQQLARDLRMTQILSMSRNQRYRLNLAANQYSITTRTGGVFNHPATNNPIMPLNSDITLSWVGLPNNHIVFNGLGAPYINTALPGTVMPANATLTLTHNSGDSRTININIQTGLVSE